MSDICSTTTGAAGPLGSRPRWLPRIPSPTAYRCGSLRAWSCASSSQTTTTSSAREFQRCSARSTRSSWSRSSTDPRSLLKAVATHQPDAVLTDIRMPPTHTTEGIVRPSRSARSTPTIGVVVLSQYVEEDYAFELLADGVAGSAICSRSGSPQLDELVRALHEVARGGSALDPKVVEGLMARKASEAVVAAAGTHRQGARGPRVRWPPVATTPRSPRRSS